MFYKYGSNKFENCDWVINLLLIWRYPLIKKIINFLFILYCSSLFSCVTIGFGNYKSDENTLEDTLEKKLQSQFKIEEPRKNEMFRVFASSQVYLREQLQKQDAFYFIKDDSSDFDFCKELAIYDKINFKSKTIIKVSLYKNSGTLAKIRFVRSSGISELDQIISEDMTRWRFKFVNKNILSSFEVAFYILLENQITKEEAKKELKKFTR